MAEAEESLLRYCRKFRNREVITKESPNFDTTLQVPNTKRRQDAGAGIRQASRIEKKAQIQILMSERVQMSCKPLSAWCVPSKLFTD